MSSRKINTLVLGLEHFIDKIGYQSQVYRKNGVSIKYLVSDRSGTSEFYANKYSADVKVLRGGGRSKVLSTARQLVKDRPKFVELYDTGHMSLIYAVLSVLVGARLILILRGGEVQRHSRKKLSLNYIKLLLITNLSFRVIVKEKNIEYEYLANKFPSHKIRRVGNAVPACSGWTDKQKDIDLLYLNSIRKNRNVDFLVEVIQSLLEKDVGIKAVIAGFNSLDDPELSFDLEEESNVLDMLKIKNLHTLVGVRGFVKNPIDLHCRAKIFLLPADVVYANYSLLESMSCGTVPVVSNGEGAELIVNEGNGYVLPLEKEIWVEKILRLLRDDNLLLSKSKGAAETIASRFSIDKWFLSMMEARQ